MLGLNWSEVDVSMVQLILMEQLLVGVLIGTLMWRKYLHHIARMALNVAGCLQVVKVLFWLGVMLMVWNLDV